MKKLFSAAALALFAIGCSGAKVKTNPDVTFPLEVSEEAPAFLFPINLSHLGSGGDPTLMGVTVSGGVASNFGKSVVSGQQLFDLVGNLSFELAEAIRSTAQSGKWEMTGSTAMISDALASTMEKVIQGLVDAKLLDKPINFRYIIAVHSHGNSTMGGTMLAGESWGGIYDMQSRRVISYIESNDNMPNQEAAVMAQLPSIYNGIIEKLLSGGVEKKEEAK